jgi:hypothetical protein
MTGGFIRSNEAGTLFLYYFAAFVLGEQCSMTRAAVVSVFLKTIMPTTHEFNGCLIALASRVVVG